MGVLVEDGCLSERDGALFVEERRASDLADEFGTPLFVLSEGRLRATTRRFASAFARHWPDGPVDVLPAFKANTTLASRAVLTQEGAGADVYSPGELDGVLRTGVDPARVSVNGGGKEPDHLARCIAAGVRITVEDPSEIALLDSLAAQAGRRAQVRIRLKPVVPQLWAPTDFSQLTVPIDLGIQVYKSGLPPEYQADVGAAALAAEHVDLVGLHIHQGRHSPSLRYWRVLMAHFARRVGELSRAWGGWLPAELDIGGGWPSPRDPHNEAVPRGEFLGTAASYPAMVALRALGSRRYHAALGAMLPAFTTHRPRRPPAPIEEYARVAVTTLRAGLRDQGIPTAGVRLQVEPGRSLYGDAGIHLARVKLVKAQRVPLPLTWVLLDTTEFFLAGGHFERSRFPFVVADDVCGAPTMTADLVGHSCFADQLVLGAKLPPVRQGQVIAFLDTGAYQEASASNFNALPRPATVLVCGRDAQVVRRAETIRDVYARDVVPDRLAGPGRDGVSS